MNNYAYLVKAKAKAADAKHLFCWLSAKSDSRADREIANILEDADIETGRGADYLQPVRTNWHVVDDLPEEGVLDSTWCDRYELGDDGLTWQMKPAAEPETPTSTSKAVVNETLKVTGEDKGVPVEKRTMAVRIAIHLLSDKYQTHISEEQMVSAMSLSMDEENAYMQTLLRAKQAALLELAELSMHSEWKLVQAIKTVFPQDLEHAPELLTQFINAWVESEPENRIQLVEGWQSGKLPAKATDGHAGDAADKMEHPITQMSFRQQVLAVFINDEFRHHLTADQRIMISDLQLDTDNSYVQNMLLAAEHHKEFKAYSCHELWKLIDALKKVLSPGGHHELNLVLRFFKAWLDTHPIDRGILVNEWIAGKRVAVIPRSKAENDPVVEQPGTSGGDAGDIPMYYKRAVAQSDANLSIEIAVALLFPEAEPGKISRAQLLDAKDYQDRKDPVHIKAVKVLIKLPDILEYNAWSIYGVTHALRWHSDETFADLRAQSRQWLTDNGTYENGQPSRGYPEWDEDTRASRHSTSAEPSMPYLAKSDEPQPEVANLGGGKFSIEGLMNPESSTSTTQQFNEGADNVSMEEAGDNEIKNALEVQPGQATNASTESGTAVSPQATALDDNFDTGHHISGVEVDSLMTHLMVDLETMGSNPEAPIVAIGAVYFDPNTGITGAEFYQIVSLESAMEFGAKPDGATIIWWLKQSPEARAAITGGEAIGLMDAVDKFDEFVHSNSANGIKSVQLWGNGSSFDNVILRRAYEQVGAELSVPFWNDRDVRTIVELGKTIGMNPRYEIPFDGDMHNALADARHQVKYVSAIWQRLVSN
jgi:exodeoxyribonuclease VIII